MIRHQTQLLGARPVNHLYLLINQLGADNKDLNWYNISTNKGIMESIVAAHPDWPWNFNALSDNINISWQFISDHPDWPWEYRNVIQSNKDITADIIVDIIADNLILKSDGYLFEHNDNANKVIDLTCNDLSTFKYRLLMNKNVSFADLIGARDAIISMMHALVLNNKDVIARVYKNYPKSEYSLGQILADAVICYQYLRNLTVADRCKKWFKQVDAGKDASPQLQDINLYDLVNYAKLMAIAASRNPNISVDAGKDTSLQPQKCIFANREVDVIFGEDAELHLWDVNELLKNPAIPVPMALSLFYDTVDRLKYSCIGNRKKWIVMDGMISKLFNNLAYHPYIDIAMFRSHPKFTDDLIKFIDNGGNIYTDDKFKLYLHKNPHMTHKDSYYFYKLYGRLNLDIGYNFDPLIRLKYLARKYFDIWIIKACIWRRKAIYECCVHELRMRFRDAEKMLVC